MRNELVSDCQSAFTLSNYKALFGPSASVPAWIKCTHAVPAKLLLKEEEGVVELSDSDSSDSWLPFDFLSQEDMGEEGESGKEEGK